MSQNGWDNSQLQNNNEGPGGFTIFLGGKQGKDLNATTITSGKHLNSFDKIFPGGKKACNSRAQIFNWSKYPFAKGSYACYKTGQWSAFDTEEMRRPVGNIFFAGEHCSEEFQGFMNGGAETGRLAAEGISNAVNKKAALVLNI